MADNILKTIWKADVSELKTAKETLSDLQSKLMGLTSEIPGLNTVMSGLGNVTDAARGAMALLVNPIVAVTAAAGAAVVALGAIGIAMAFKGMERIDALSDAAQRLGLSADQFYYYSQAAKDSGGSIDEVIALNEKLNKAMANSGIEMKGVGAAFVRLGVDTKDTSGKLKSTEAVLGGLSAAWDKSAKTASDYADMTQILGKQFEAKLNTYKAVKEAEEELQAMYALGIGVSKASEAAINANEKANRGLGAVLNSMSSILVEAVIPALTSLTNWFVKSYTEGGFVAKVFNTIVIASELLMLGIKALAAGFLVIVESVSLMGDAVVVAFTTVSKFLEGVGKAWDHLKNNDLYGAADALKDGWKAAGDAVDAGGKKMENRIGAVAQTINDLNFSAPKIEALFSGDSIINRPKKELTPPEPNALFKGTSGGSTRAEDKVKKVDKVDKDPIDALIESLKKQLDVSNELNVSDRIANELRDQKYAKSSRQGKIDAQEIADKLSIANANKSVSALTDAITKQTTGSLQLNAVETLALELQKKKNQGANDATIKTAELAAANLDLVKSYEMTNGAIDSARRSSRDFVQNLEDEIKSRGRNKRDIKQELELRKIQQNYNDAINKQNDEGTLSAENLIRLNDERVDSIQRVVDVSKAAKIADDDWLGNGVQNYVTSLGTWQEAATNLTQKGIQGMQEGLSSLFTGGEFSWRSFVASILKGIADMIIKFTIITPIVEALKNSLSAMKGSSGSGLGGLLAKGLTSLFSAQGNTFTSNFAQGVVSSPTTGFFGPNQTKSMVGEAGDEAIVPLKRNAAGDLGVMLTGGGGGSSPNVTQVNNITIQGSSNGNKNDDESMAKMISAHIDKKWQDNYAKAMRPGGVANRAGQLSF